MRSVLKRMMMRSKKMKNKSLNIRARTINNKMQIRKSNLKWILVWCQSSRRNTFQALMATSLMITLAAEFLAKNPTKKSLSKRSLRSVAARRQSYSWTILSLIWSLLSRHSATSMGWSVTRRTMGSKRSRCTSKTWRRHAVTFGTDSFWPISTCLGWME